MVDQALPRADRYGSFLFFEADLVVGGLLIVQLWQTDPWRESRRAPEFWRFIVHCLWTRGCHRSQGSAPAVIRWVEHLSAIATRRNSPGPLPAPKPGRIPHGSAPERQIRRDIAIGRRVRGQRDCGVLPPDETWFVGFRQLDQPFYVVRTYQTMVVKCQEALHCLLGSLLAVINRRVERTVWNRTDLTRRSQIIIRLDEPGMNQLALGVIH